MSAGGRGSSGRRGPSDDEAPSGDRAAPGGRVPAGDRVKSGDRAPSGDRATVSVLVAVPQATAFDVFTREIDLWWRKGPKFRFGRQPGALTFEPLLGGRLFESFDSESGVHVREVGRVIVWEPPSRVVLTWRNVNFADDESTEVEVSFAPSESGTLVTVQHRGWGAIRADHPARHGLQGAEFSRMIGLWWGDLMTAMRVYIVQKNGSAC